MRQKVNKGCLFACLLMLFVFCGIRVSAAETDTIDLVFIKANSAGKPSRSFADGSRIESAVEPDDIFTELGTNAPSYDWLAEHDFLVDGCLFGLEYEYVDSDGNTKTGKQACWSGGIDCASDQWSDLYPEYDYYNGYTSQEKLSSGIVKFELPSTTVVWYLRELYNAKGYSYNSLFWYNDEGVLDEEDGVLIGDGQYIRGSGYNPTTNSWYMEVHYKDYVRQWAENNPGYRMSRASPPDIYPYYEYTGNILWNHSYIPDTPQFSKTPDVIAGSKGLTTLEYTFDDVSSYDSYRVIIHEKLGEGMVLDEVTAALSGPSVVYAELLLGTEPSQRLYVVENPSDGCSFHLESQDLYEPWKMGDISGPKQLAFAGCGAVGRSMRSGVADDFVTFDSGDSILVYCKVRLENNVSESVNTAWVTYETDTGVGTTDTDTSVLKSPPIKMRVNKVSQNSVALVGASFSLYKWNYRENAYSELIESIDGNNISSFDFSLTGQGCYKLVETKAPDGCNVIDPVYFRVVYNEDLTLNVSGDILYVDLSNNWELYDGYYDGWGDEKRYNSLFSTYASGEPDNPIDTVFFKEHENPGIDVDGYTLTLTVVNDVVTTEKPKFEKQLEADFGGSYYMSLNLTIPSDIMSYDEYRFVLHDRMDENVVFDGLAGIVLNDEKNVDLNLVENPDDGCTFHLESSDLFALWKDGNSGTDKYAAFDTDVMVSPGDILTVFYMSKLKPDAHVGQNTAWCSYASNLGSGKTDDSSQDVKSLKLTVNKLDSSGSPLSGARFALYKWGKQYSSIEESQGYVEEIMADVSDDGSIFSFDLRDYGIGMYKLAETVVPDGYGEIDPVYFYVTYDDAGKLVISGDSLYWGSYGLENSLGTYDYLGDEKTYFNLTDASRMSRVAPPPSPRCFFAEAPNPGISLAENGYELVLDVVNHELLMMPDTGSIGTRGIFLLGAGFIVLGLVYFLKIRRKV